MPALFRRRQVWLPTWQGALLLVVVVAASALIGLRHLATWLAPHDPAVGRDGQGARTLIVEGWLDEDGLDAAIAVIARGRYERVVASGGPIDSWREGQRWPTYAERAADYLRRHGVTAIPVVAVAAPESMQDRTFVSAVVVRDWLRRQAMRRRRRSLLGQRSRAPFTPRLPDGIRPGRRGRRHRGAAAALSPSNAGGRRATARRQCSTRRSPSPGRRAASRRRRRDRDERRPVPRSPA